MRDIWFFLTEHKNALKIGLVILFLFAIGSVGVSFYISNQQARIEQEQKKEEQKKKKQKQLKKSSVKLSASQKKTIDKYDDETAQFSALLSSNIWATYSGSGRTIYFTDSSIIVSDPNADEAKAEKPFVIKALSTEKVDVGELKNLTRYTCAYETDDDNTHVLTLDKNDDGSYFKMQIDVNDSGKSEEYTRTQSAETFSIEGISDELSALLGNAKEPIEDYVREQVALFYPTTAKAQCSGVLEADFNANQYEIDFELLNDSDQHISSISVVYHLNTGECETL